MVEARKLGSKLIVQAFICLGRSAKEGGVLSHVTVENVDFDVIVGIPL